jgi:hypothetical protein
MIAPRRPALVLAPNGLSTADTDTDGDFVTINANKP